MDALGAFTTYLAQAHGRRRVAAIAPDRPPAPAELADALPVCALQDAGAPSAGAALDALRDALAVAPAGVAVLDGDGRGAGDLAAACALLARHGLAPAFVGRAAGAAVAVLDRGCASAPAGGPPPGFRVVAIVPSYDEEDVAALTVADLVAQGVEVVLLDNWSRDATVERARPFLGHGLRAVERFPPGGPPATYDLRRLLRRVEELAVEHDDASWVVLHDADERRRSPWASVGLRDALWRVERCGFDCVDHVTVEFWPTTDVAFDPARGDVEAQLPYFRFSDHPGHFHQRRAWRRAGDGRVSLAPSAGHDVQFPGRRVFPYKFLLKHYPIRSQAHGERKLDDRERRWNAEERALGWHRQYDAPSARRFVRDPATLRRFDPATFPREFLVERLSGAGVFAEPPPWATPPRW